VGDLGDPASQLRIEVGHGGEGAGGEERMAEEADKAFDAALGESSRLQRMRGVRRRLSG
jgi:hypothetical protein